ncbi:hypothetical protein [Streptomyces sp. SP17KL33]|uniref:hypothetical protein n=1 Tax=Streptomyces sp. SP17KL33 TaxID=3002534 RepID=UPI002E75FD0C|nr:hypothetical protein [Streptomyces sp. SP17KL33]MEE1838128.1 hypothetical protein [Streptomyces sp. SP17KL33]
MDHPSPRPPQLTGAASVMFDAMSQISEAAFGLRWAQDTEFGVWTLLTDPGACWGCVRADDADVAPALVTVAALVRQTRLWVTWPAGQPGPQETPLANWRARYQSTMPTARRLLA